jgi:hypothetical protein
MVHLEQITVWIPNDTPDYYGGIYEGYIPATNAPTWATIRQTSGNQIGILGGTATEGVFEMFFNTLDGWSWKQGYLIESRFGYISIDSYTEDIRKRLIRAEGNITTMDNFI